MDDIIARIKHRLAYLQQHDDGDVVDATHERRWQVENSYPYTLQEPHTEQQVAEFEAKHRINLPEDYRQFLLNVGCSGVGPFDNFYSPITQMGTPNEVEAVKDQAHLSEDDFLKIDNLPLWELSQPFLFTEPTADMIDLLLDQGLEDVDAYRGQIILSEQGGNVWQSLIVTGKCRGQMWYLDSDQVTPIYIATEADRRSFELNEADTSHFTPETRVTFTQWYEAWLNKQISIAQEHWHKRGRTVPPLNLEDDIHE